MRYRMIARTLALTLTVAWCAPCIGFSQTTPENTSHTTATGTKEIALTFDNLPSTVSFSAPDREAIVLDIIDALKSFDAKAMGFVVGDAIEEQFDLLGTWLNEGNQLGSMTHSNQDYHEVEPGRFFEDARIGSDAIEPMLQGFGQKKRYFRFPFLHDGATTRLKQQAAGFFGSRAVTVVPATIVPEDYLFDFNVQKLGRTPDSAKLEQIGTEYLHHLFMILTDAEDAAERIKQRPVRQILLLRANRLNAYFLPDILAGLQERGYRFVTVDRALGDDVYRISESYTTGRGIGFLDRILQTNPKYASER